jgi:glycosyltransferase involved in cell wall biosynthesis
MRIFATQDGTGCGYYRVVLPLGQLAAHGHEITFREGRSAYFSEMADYPLIVGQRIDKQAALPFWRRLRLKSRLVYEVDDDVFSVDQLNWQAYEIYQRAETRDAVAHASQVSNLVTVTSEYLAEVMREHNPNVKVLPNFIPAMVLDLPAPAGDRPAVGWMGGASHGRDVQLIARPLRTFLSRHKDWDSVLIGTDYRPTIRHHRCGFIPWTNIQADPEAYYRSLDFDIGLAPLFPTTFARSKSRIKALEYAARGIPVIASDAEPYRDFVLHGVTGYLVKRDHEWLKYLEELAADPGMRAEMGAKAKEHARGFLIEENWRMWADAYERLS